MLLTCVMCESRAALCVTGEVGLAVVVSSVLAAPALSCWSGKAHYSACLPGQCGLITIALADFSHLHGLTFKQIFSPHRLKLDIHKSF